MVHFDFVMKDVDAENMLRSLHLCACDINEQILDANARTDISEDYRFNLVSALRDAQQYQFDLIKLMKNTRVPE
jgi:hypothetical protein